MKFILFSLFLTCACLINVYVRDSAIIRVTDSMRIELTDDEVRERMFVSSDYIYFPETGTSCSVSIIKYERKLTLITSEHCCNGTNFGKIGETTVGIGKTNKESDLCELVVHNHPNPYFTNRGTTIAPTPEQLMDTVYSIGNSPVVVSNSEGGELYSPYFKVNHNKGYVDSILSNDYTHLSSRMYQGMSGGPTLNRKGEIVGINSRTDHYKYGIITSSSALKRFLNE